MKFKWTFFHTFLIIGLIVLVVEIIGYYIDFIAIQDPAYWENDLYYNRFANFAYGLVLFWPVFLIIALTLWIIEYGIRTYPGRVWLLITIGLFIWGLADSYSVIRWFFLHDEEYPELNIARFLYVIGYLVMIIGLILQIRVGQTKLSKSNYIVLGLISLVIIGVSLWFVIIPLILYPLDPLDESFTIISKVFLIYFSVMDVILIVLVLLLVFRYQGGQFAISWLIVGIGFLIMALFDLQNAYIGYLLYEQYAGVFWYDNLWYLTGHLYNISYLLIALGALNFRRSVKNV